MTLLLSEVQHETDLFEVTILSRGVAVSKSEVELTIGYADDSTPAYVGEMIDDVLSKLPQRCDIKAGYRLVDLERSSECHDGLYVGGTFFHVRNILTSQLKGSEKAALFLCTIGSGMETWAKQLSREGEVELSYIVDIVASVATENAADMLHDHIGHQMKKRGLGITNRYSPGYCDWSVSEQQLLFSFLPEQFCGITLTESALMVPIKSVSGIVGVGATVKRMDYICDRCGIKECTHRTFRMARTERLRRNQ